ncbi:hypothetical protein ASZ90_016909 [hydrocarbon metagenome]|uniref:Uncharacterized protein n=1 Tax=hydrocarbon metagenome TaxID=938273 RepID=A0A0W8EAS4_9ZZZZ
MPGIEVHRNTEKTFTKRARGKSGPTPDNNQGSQAEKLSGMLKIKDPRSIEEIAESDLLV